VLGVDPGTVVTGWGVVERFPRQVRRVASGVVRPRGTRAERLAAICRELGAICRQFQPDALSLEQSFVGDNVQTAFRLGEARGAVMVAAADLGLPVAEYSPAEIKVAIVGSGRAAKSQVQSMVSLLLAVEAALAADEADALGAAICHIHTSRFAVQVARSEEGSKGPRIQGFKGSDLRTLEPSNPRTPLRRGVRRLLVRR
jgi:crossover junction endodeoxyribonuclease RuvC